MVMQIREVGQDEKFTPEEQKKTFWPGDKVQIDYISDVKLTGGKKNPLQGQVRKLTSVQATICNPDEYRSRVQKTLVSEGKSTGDYDFGKRAWGERVGKTALIEHKGERYLEFLVDKNLSTFYLVNGHLTDAEDIDGLPKKSERKVNVDIRCIKQGNIVEITHLD